MTLESAENNRLTLSLSMNKTHAVCSESGQLHGGVVSSLVDTSCSLAVMLKLGRLIRVQTLDMRLDYLRSVTAEGVLWSRASCYRLTEQMALVRATAFTVDEGKENKVAKANASFLVIHQQRVPV